MAVTTDPMEPAMTRFLATSALTLSLLAGASAAQAQSYNAPAGIPSATAPGSSVEVNVGRSWSTTAPGAYDSLTTGSTARGAHDHEYRW